MCREIPAEKDLYAVLGIKPTASMTEIRAAYRKAALKTHPDKEGGSVGAFHDVAFAFDVLSCSSARTMYDRARARHFVVHRSSSNLTQSPNSQAGESRVNLATRKRPASHDLEGAKKKRVCAAFQKGEVTANKHEGVFGCMDAALNNLRGVLQSMHVEWRQTSIAKLTSRTRNTLLAFMESKGNETEVSQRGVTRSKGARPANVRTRQLKLQPTKSTYGRAYSAQVDIGLLRIYTRGQRNIERAIEHQLILSQIRDALCAEVAANCEAWKDVNKIQALVSEVMRKNGSSEKELDLRTCVQMRATEYVHRNYVITSPVMSMAKALALRTHLVSARNTSWESFRDQWIKLMCSTRNARSKGLSRKAAEDIANNARREFLETRLKCAICNVESLTGKGAREVRRSTRKSKHTGCLSQSFLGIKRNGRCSDRQMWSERMKLLLQRELSSDETARFLNS